MKLHGRTRKKIAFFGHFNSTNFGNEATLQSILYHIRGFQPDAELACISTGAETTATTHQLEAIQMGETVIESWSSLSPLNRGLYVCIEIPREAYRWIQVLITLRRTDMFIVPGTGLLTDAYGLRNWGPYNLFKWSLMAKICRCKLLFVSVGAGPVYSGLGRFFVKSALYLADYRSYRDNSTKQYLKDIGFRADNDCVCPDLVFSFPTSMIPGQSAKKSARFVVGLGLMEYAGKYSVARPNIEIYQAYLDNLVIFVRWLITNKYDIRLLRGDIGDVHTMQEFKGLLRERLSDCDYGHIIEEPVSSVKDLVSQIAATDIVVATRFHNVLLATLCNKPVMAISCHHKCASLMSAMGLSTYCLDINDLKADALIEKFRDVKTNAGVLRHLIREKAKEFGQALDDQYQVILNYLDLRAAGSSTRFAFNKGNFRGAPRRTS
jgi:polysaccharide pyruvyl transferase WcaK-like protein